MMKKLLVASGRNHSSPSLPVATSSALLLPTAIIQPNTRIRKFHSSQAVSYGYQFKERTELVREFIHDSLYNPEYGYFNKKDHELIITHPLLRDEKLTNTASIENDQFENDLINNNLSFDEQMILPFHELQDQLDYLENLSELYQRGPQSWGTPIEIFQPYYGIAIAEYMLRTTYGEGKNENLDKPLKIYEMGGGMGTCARNVLDYLEKEYPEVYKRTEYNIIEISSQLHEQQKIRCARHVRNGKLKLFHASFMDWANIEQDECFVIAMEVLDNCAHDKVSIDGQGNVLECHVFEDSITNYYGEVFLPCQDELIIRYLYLSGIIEESTPNSSNTAISSQYFYKSIEDLRGGKIKKAIRSFFSKSVGGMRSLLMSSIGGDHVMFIPTVQLQIIEKLQQNFPKHRLICADFDYLGTDEPGESNRPLVQKKFKFMKASNLLRKVREHGTIFLKKEDVTSEENFSVESHAFRSYLVPKGECDIFFATDFATMQQVYGKVCKDGNGALRGSKVVKSSQFMNQYAQKGKFDTKSGYNPLLRDYSNFSFFLS
ncbi:hypothetical protein C9374_004315 [Naegleria lovaniensis]|uniref:Protein arginine methyltransferase NDUFAF7 n=1 Tax=Naegleria lovaniensis TaxID=51637 RepID=A0AA88KJ76_NAELO|nr:uncharacterized protein C9374_004315 [Naegleria lovaniensis]KAG2383644.1 hypothetical protein C9374_004315 [Naegleria lovaniensis]